MINNNSKVRWRRSGSIAVSIANFQKYNELYDTLKDVVWAFDFYGIGYSGLF